MSNAKKKINKDNSPNINNSEPISELEKNTTENKNNLIGNKREREKTEEKEINNNKICIYCKDLITSDYLEFEGTTPNKIILDSFSKLVSDEKFLKILQKDIDKISETKEINKKAIICHNCFLENFIKGGLEKIFVDSKDYISFMNKDIGNDEHKKNLKQIIDVYSINLNLAIKSLKNLKAKYSKTIELTYSVLDNIGIRVMLSNYKEAFPELKRKLDICKQSLKEVDENFDNLINNLSLKEELKKFFIEGIYSNDNLLKNNLLKVLKQLENEIEFSTIKINGSTPLFKNETIEPKKINSDKKMDKNDKKDKNKNKNIFEAKNDVNNNNNNVSNNNNNGLLNNLQNKKKQNINELLKLNDIEKTETLKNNLFFSPKNYNLMLNNPFDQYMNLGLGLMPNVDLPQNGLMGNNMLFNNLFPPSLNPQLLSQINNSNPIFQNNNNNCQNNNSIDNNNINPNNLNNPNNLSFTGNSCLQRLNNNFNSMSDSLKEFESSFLRNIANNNNQNNLVNNLNNSNLLPLISPNNYMFTPSFNNYGISPLLLYNNMGAQNNNDILNLSQNINNNNNIDLNKINQYNLMNINADNKGINLNNLNIINDMNNVNNMGTNNLNPLNGLNNNLNKNEINNNNNILLYSGQQQTFNIPNQSNILVNLINCVDKEKDVKNLSNNENNPTLEKNINQNNTQTNTNINKAQQISEQSCNDSSNVKSETINNIDNNNIVNNNIEDNGLVNINNSDNNKSGNNNDNELNKEC